jgi:hypothetical protein
MFSATIKVKDKRIYVIVDVAVKRRKPSASKTLVM